MANRYDIEGTYVEACSCGEGCQCCAPGQPTRDTCRLSAVWSIGGGRAGDTSLDGLAVVGVHGGPCVGDHDAKTTLYADERATPEQRRALEEIFIQGRCGVPAGLDHLVHGADGLRYAAVSFERTGDRLRVEVPGVVSSTLEVGAPGAGAGFGAGRSDMEVAAELTDTRVYAFISRFHWRG